MGESSVMAVWVDLSGGLDVIYKTHQRVSPQRYMDLYTSVFNHCTKSPDENRAPPIVGTRRGQNAQPQAGAEFVGSEFYERLQDYMRKYVQELLKDCKHLNGEELLEQYTSLWQKYQFSSTVVNGIFAYLNRHWIKRAIDEGRPGIYETYNLAVNVWKEVIFESLHHNVTSAMLNLITQERNSELITTKLIKGTIDSYIELGINETQDVNPVPVLHQDNQTAPSTRENRTLKLTIYKKYFEQRFLEETRNYYMTESSDFIQKHHITEYMKKVESRLGEERDRCELYLDSSTQEPLAKACEEVLIQQHLEMLHSEFEGLLQAQYNDDLRRMFSLCQRVPSALDKLREVFETHIEREGRGAIQQISDIAINDSKQYVIAILEVYYRFNLLVIHSFFQESGFVQAMDKAFTVFINDNQVTVTAKSHTKSPELLARYCDLLLRKSAKNPEENEMENLLNDVMIIFKYIEDKDVFQKFYSKMLAKRLVTDSSASDESELSMIAKLKQMCGFEYTTKLQRMFTDASLSKDLTESYKRQTKGGIDFSIMVLASSVWPYSQTTQFEIPKALSEAIDNFTQLYNKTHNGRKLSWLLHMGRGDLVSACFAKRYTLTCTTAQMSVLIQFNDALSLSMQALSTALGLPLLQPGSQTYGLEQVVRSLIKADLLKMDGNALTLDSVVHLNSNFSNKKLKVDVSRMVLAQKEASKKETEEVQKSVEEDRRMVIQAAIVRIMKMRKTLKHQNLIAEVLQQLSARFQPKIPTIKTCIDMLIEKEYIKRSESSRDSYEYLA